LLEHFFPARDPSITHAYTSIPLAECNDDDRDKDRDSNVGDEENVDEEAGQKRRGKLNLRNTAIKWFIDCITLGAIMNTTAFIVIMGVLKGQEPATIWQNMKDKMVRIILDGYKLWPLASVISFSFIPVERRIVFFSFVGLCWNVYLSLMAARL
jgi:Mpv17 / PMP22 family